MINVLRHGADSLINCNRRSDLQIISVHSEVQCLIFDCDGTLADTMPLHLDAWGEAFATIGITCPRDFLDQFKGVPAEKIVEHVNEAFGYGLDVREITKEKQKRVRKKLLHAEPIEPVVEVAVRYKKRLPMAVASGGIRTNVDLTLEAIGLNNFFDTVITADDPVKPKPSPEIFLEAARRLNVEPLYCQVFEDGDSGIEAARKAGMIVTDVRLFV
jgi:HAD superfamily hydrolase (TIGR01509 family)